MHVNTALKATGTPVGLTGLHDCKLDKNE